MRAAYLGPRGTFSDEALRLADPRGTLEAVATESIPGAILAVEQGEIELALVPIENSIEGPVNATLDTLLGEAPGVCIVGETVLAVQQCLIAAVAQELAEVRTVRSHPQALAQCARFLRRELPGARILAASSSADAVREVTASGTSGAAALGPPLAAQVYGGVVLREAVQDAGSNQTRFVWLARRGTGVRPPGVERSPGPKTSLVFWGPGDTGPGWLVGCLDEIAARGINLTRIESRPRRVGLGHYLFVADLEGAHDDGPVSEAIAGLGRRCEAVRLLGSYPAASDSHGGDTEAV